MTTRRQLLAGCVGALLSSRIARSQTAGRTYQVGILAVAQNPAQPKDWDPFVETLHDLGYHEGKNLVLHRKFGDGRFDQLPKMLGEILGAKVDVIVATGTREIRAAKEATGTIPIVMHYAVDPVKQGFVASLARPGGNVTGLTSLIPGLSQKNLELLREVVPAGRRFAVVAIAPQPVPETRLELESAAKAGGVELILMQPAGPEDFDRVMADAKKRGVAGIIHPLDGATDAHRSAFVQAALKHRLPGIYWSERYVEAGGLMTYSINRVEQFKRVATYVAKILSGAKPAVLPVEQPARVELVINMNTAKILGIKLPQSILLRARVTD